jgi:glycosyltransferase involved in cell wall biosynthesis
MPKVSVVTIVWNNRAHIAAAIESVLAQDYPDIEYIVKDGGSTDGTLEVVQKYGDRVKLLTGRDKGLYDGLNKGLQATSGEIIMHLNSDDFYSSKSSVSKIVEAMERTHTDIAWGDIVYVDREDKTKVTRNWKSSSYAPGRFQRGWHPPHSGFSVRRSVYERYGWFNTDFRISADYELMLRFLEKNQVPSCYVPETIVTMRAGGVSGGFLARLTKVRREDLKAWQLNGLKGGLLATLLKPASKIFQWI